MDKTLREDGEDRARGAPFCTTCKHYHVDVRLPAGCVEALRLSCGALHCHAQDLEITGRLPAGDNCKVCGHGGRVVVIPGPNGPRPNPGFFHTTVYDYRAEKQPRAVAIAALLRCVRSRGFSSDMNMPFMVDPDEFDATSRHVLALIGDAPVAYVRWRLVPAALLRGDAAAAAAAQASGTGPFVILLERLLTVGPLYRKKGYSKLVMTHALADAAAHVGPQLNAERTLAKASMIVPALPICIPAARAALGIGMLNPADAMAVDPTGQWGSNPVYEFSMEPAVIGTLLQRWSVLPAEQGGPIPAEGPSPA